ncbi:MAG: SCO family protein [Sphingobacteriales bacterium]|nr:MAG: SCO family protein [Sphingobacteriales bacterium]
MAKKNSNKKFFKGLAVAFLLPLSFYLIAKVMSKDKIHLPNYYVADRVDTTTDGGNVSTDTVFHKVADINLVNQFGKPISINNDLRGKILVVDFFFVSCPSVCPRLTGNMGLLQKAFRRNPKMESSLDTAVHFLSITVNPERDTFPALRAYADKHQANHDHWWFLTGNKKDIYNYARNELRVYATPGDGGAEDFVHTEKLVLLDQDRYIRGYYNGLDTADLRKCADDIVLLTLEKKRKKK